MVGVGDVIAVMTVIFCISLLVVAVVNLYATDAKSLYAVKHFCERRNLSSMNKGFVDASYAQVICYSVSSDGEILKKVSYEVNGDQLLKAEELMIECQKIGYKGED